MSTDFRRHGDDWLSDIFNYSEGGRISVCAICKQKEAINQDDIFSVCKKCNRRGGTGYRTRAAHFRDDDSGTIDAGRYGQLEVI